MRVDHLVPDDLRALVERIRREQGRMHVLVNDIFGATKMEWTKSVWESDLEYGLHLLRLAIGVRLHRSRRQPARRLAQSRRSAGRRQTRRRDRLPLSPTTLARSREASASLYDFFMRSGRSYAPI